MNQSIIFKVLLCLVSTLFLDQSQASFLNHITRYGTTLQGKPAFLQDNAIPSPGHFMQSDKIHGSPPGRFATVSGDSFDSSKFGPPKSNIRLTPLTKSTSYHGDKMPLHGNTMQQKAEAMASLFRSDYDSEFRPNYGAQPNTRETCFQEAESRYYNITDIMYDYPEQAIFSELHQRPDVLMSIYSSKHEKLEQPTFKSGSSGCSQRVSVLEGFMLHGGRCWLIYPRHQNVQFVTCSYPRCSGTGTSRCSARDVIKSVWAWCEVLPHGHNIGKVQLPLPVSCRCASYSC